MAEIKYKTPKNGLGKLKSDDSVPKTVDIQSLIKDAKETDIIHVWYAVFYLKDSTIHLNPLASKPDAQLYIEKFLKLSPEKDMVESHTIIKRNVNQYKDGKIL